MLQIIFQKDFDMKVGGNDLIDVPFMLYYASYAEHVYISQYSSYNLT